MGFPGVISLIGVISPQFISTVVGRGSPCRTTLHAEYGSLVLGRGLIRIAPWRRCRQQKIVDSDRGDKLGPHFYRDYTTYIGIIPVI